MAAQVSASDRPRVFLPVAAGHGGLRRFGVEVLVEVARGAAVDLQQALARTGLAVILLGQRHTCAARQLLDSLDIAEIVVLAHKVDDIARRTAAEAVKALGIRVNDEGRRFFHCGTDTDPWPCVRGGAAGHTGR